MSSLVKDHELSVSLGTVASPLSSPFLGFLNSLFAFLADCGGCSGLGVCGPRRKTLPHPGSGPRRTCCCCRDEGTAHSWRLNRRQDLCSVWAFWAEHILHDIPTSCPGDQTGGVGTWSSARGAGRDPVWWQSGGFSFSRAAKTQKTLSKVKDPCARPWNCQNWEFPAQFQWLYITPGRQGRSRVLSWVTCSHISWNAQFLSVLFPCY